MDEYKELAEKQLSSEEIFQGCLLHVQRDKVELPNGAVATRELIRHIGAVCIVPVNDKGEVYVERQFRYPLNRVITEIPAGKLDSADEDRLEAAKRELREETGLTADTWSELGIYYPAAAYSNEVLTLYLAQDLHQGERDLDEDEFLNVKAVPLKDLIREIEEGKIGDGKTQTALLLAARRLGV